MTATHLAHLVEMFLMFSISMLLLVILTTLKEIASFLCSLTHVWCDKQDEFVWRLKWERQQLEQKCNRRSTDRHDYETNR